MASPSRRHRRRHPHTPTGGTRLAPELAAARDSATATLQQALDALGDPIGTALELLSGEQFAALVWQLPQPSRTRFLARLGVPSARRPTATLARMGLSRLLRWPKHERDHAAEHLTERATERLEKAWIGNAGDATPRDDAIRDALTRDPSQVNVYRLAMICHARTTMPATVALRVGLDTAAGVPDWDQSAVDAVITACRALEDVWVQIGAVEPDATNESAPATGTDQTEPDHASNDESTGGEDDGPATIGGAKRDGGPQAGPQAEVHVQLSLPDLHSPHTGTISVAGEGTDLTGEHLVWVQQQAQQAVTALTKALHRGEIPPSSLLNPVAAFIATGERIRGQLREQDETVPANATVEQLLAALAAAVDADKQRCRLARITALTGPETEHDRISAATQLAGALHAAPVWDGAQREHATGLLALLDIIDAAAATDMQALAAALATAEEHLPDSIAALRFPALAGQLHLTAPQDPVVGQAGSQPADKATDPTADVPAASPDGAPAEGPAVVNAAPVDEDQAVDSGDPVAGTAGQRDVSVPVMTGGKPSATVGDREEATVLRPEPVTVDARSADNSTAGSDPGLADVPGSSEASRGLVRQLLGNYRLALAYHGAVACGDRRRADALRILTLADAVRTDTAPTAGALRTAIEAEQGSTGSGDTAVQLLLLAGTVRACLATADAAAGRVAQTVATALQHLPALSAVGDTIGSATMKRRLYNPDMLATLAPIAGADNDIAMTVETARSIVAKPRRLDFVRANQIIDVWWAPNGVIGRLLASAADDRRSELDTVTEQLRLFAKRQYLDDLLDREDARLRSSSGRVLQGQQRHKLKEIAENSVSAVRDWADAVRADQAAAHGPVSADLARLRQEVLTLWPAAEHELQSLISAGVDTPWMLQADAARACLTSMQGSVAMLDGIKPPGGARDPELALNQDLLRSANLPFCADHTPSRPVTIDDVREAAATNWQDAFTARLTIEDYAAAGMIAEVVGDTGLRRDMHDRLAAAAAESFTELAAMHAETAAAVDRATRLGQLDENASSAVTSTLAAADLTRLTSSPQHHNLGVFRIRLLDVRTQLPQYLHDAQEALRKRGDNEVPAGPKRQQQLADINARIDDGDLATAEEYLLAAVNGDELPTAKPSDDLNRFLQLTTQARGITRELITAIRQGKPIPQWGVTDLTAAQRATADTLQTWLDMRGTRHGKVQKTSLTAALRLAGVEFSNMQPLRELTPSSRRAWWDLTEVRRIGETPGVPQFSPSAGQRLRVMLCWGEPDVRAMFGWIGQDPGIDDPVIVLLFAAMTAAQRSELAVMCARRGEKPVIVIDDIAMLHLALHGSGQFMASARTLLPFAATNPYAPDGLAALPLEMFFGRRSERSDIIDPHGANLLYGGRQLGKTALLQEAARAFGRVETNLPIYITLHNAMGTTVNPLTLWDKLAERLTELKILPARKTPDPVKAVTTAIKTWLTENPVRRMLLLIDECDGFFDADAQLGFPHVTHLRNLRDDTVRRFKPVFAGLHQVQRFAHLPNQPLAGAHLGQQIAIGPLNPEPAYQLLFTPMEALGIRFASDALIHRVLAFCNYQPKLLQLVGKEVVAAALARRSDGPYYTIDEQTLNQILISEPLQQRVRQTVRLTLDLDSRYKLIALVVAYAALEHSADHTMTTTQLREECQSWWPAGFAGQGPSEFRSLLDEMRELGVLAVTAGARWRLRSTNVLRLLGSTNDIWEELCSSQWRTMVTKLSTEEARGHLADGSISPCTEQQLSRIVNRTAGSTVRVVAGTTATGIGKVNDLLEQSHKGFGARFNLVVPNSPQAYGKALRGGDAADRHHVVLSQLLVAKPETVNDTVVKARRIPPAVGVTRTVAVAVDLNAPGILDMLTGPGFAVGDDDVITLRRATGIGVRGWLSDNEPMNAFTDAASQTQLMAATGGWPMLLDLAVDKAREHASIRKVCNHITAYLATPDGAAELIDAVGLRTDAVVSDAFQSLIDYDGPVTADELVELSAVAGTDAHRTARTLQLLDVLDQSAVDGRWTPEPVTATAWRYLHTDG
jgi:hypothetical protein